MKIIKDDIEKNARKWEVPSKSHIGEYHKVMLLEDGEYMCDNNCMAWKMGKICSHIQMATGYNKTKKLL